MHFSRGRLERLGVKYQAFKPEFYYGHYETHLAVDPNDVRAVLELGVREGGSLLAWMEFFPQAQIFGVDLGTVTLAGNSERIHLLQADQTDTTAIGNFLQSHGVDSIDIIIDDCAHVGFLAKQSFWYLYNSFLKPGGYYVIEDWGVGYWDTWPDGAKLIEPDPASEPNGVFHSHENGLPGFIKQLIDQPIFESIVLTAAFAVMKKPTEQYSAEIARSTI
jgi:hypothetical protein